MIRMERPPGWYRGGREKASGTLTSTRSEITSTQAHWQGSSALDRRYESAEAVAWEADQRGEYCRAAWFVMSSISDFRLDRDNRLWCVRNGEPV